MLALKKRHIEYVYAQTQRNLRMRSLKKIVQPLYSMNSYKIKIKKAYNDNYVIVFFDMTKSV